MIAVIAETGSELVVDLLCGQRPGAPKPAGRRPRSRRPFPDQLVDLLRERNPISGSQPVQPVPRRLGHLDGRHGHTGQYTSAMIGRQLRPRSGLYVSVRPVFTFWAGAPVERAGARRGTVSKPRSMSIGRRTGGPAIW